MKKRTGVCMKKMWIVLLVAANVIVGCSSITKNKYCIVSTQSGIGFSVGVKDTNQTPEVRLGYMRNEMVFIPVEGDNVAPVLARLNYSSIWARQAGIASTVSTGKAAINQSCFNEESNNSEDERIGIPQ